jgi:Holliday junction resolvasome RuvABC endonuclease subunit
MIEIPAVVGLDTSTLAWHACIWQKGDWSIARSEPKGDTDGRRIKMCQDAKEFFSLLPDGSWIMQEEPIHIQNGRTTRLLAIASGAIWAQHLDFNLWHAWVGVSSWKHDVIGNGAAKKEQVAGFFNDRDIFYDVQDLYDARGLAVYGLQQLGLRKQARSSIQALA